jgi:hypothetical protein
MGHTSVRKRYGEDNKTERRNRRERHTGLQNAAVHLACRPSQSSLHALRKKEGAFPATTDAVDCRSLRSPPPEELSVWDRSLAITPEEDYVGPIRSLSVVRWRRFNLLEDVCRDNLPKRVGCNFLSYHNRPAISATDRVCSPPQAITMNEVIVRIWAQLSSNIDCCQEKFPRFL